MKERFEGSSGRRVLIQAVVAPVAIRVFLTRHVKLVMLKGGVGSAHRDPLGCGLDARRA